MLFRWVSVKKLFIVLLVLIIGLLVMFFVHGPYIDPDAEKAVADVLLAEAAQAGENAVPAEGHRFLQVTQAEDVLQVWGVFSTAAVQDAAGGDGPAYIKKAVPGKMIFEKKEDGWSLQEYIEPEADSGEMKKVFPFHLRIALLFSGLFDADLEEQIQAYAAKQAA